MATDPEMTLKIERPPVDPILFALVLMAEEGHTSGMPVTLNIHGFLVSGLLCSRKDYMMEGEAYAAGIVGFEASKALFWLHEYAKNSEALAGEKGEEIERAGDFIHLKEADFLSSAFHLATEGGIPWRGKLSSIDAFSFGKLRPNRSL
jgi:hypothetical protein